MLLITTTFAGSRYIYRRSKLHRVRGSYIRKKNSFREQKLDTAAVTRFLVIFISDDRNWHKCLVASTASQATHSITCFHSAEASRLQL